MKILVLLPRFPYPLEKGDKLRAYNQIKYLAKNHKIHLVALTDVNLEPSWINALVPFCESIQVIHLSKWRIALNILRAFFMGLPLQVGYFYNGKAQKKINKIIREVQPDHIYCQLIRVAEYVKIIPVPKTLDYQDVFSKGVERRARTASWFMKPILKSEYRRLCRYENAVFDRFDNKTIISIPDRDLIPHPQKDNIEIVINGVDFKFFKPIETEKEYELVFIGNMGYPPNINAAEFLVKKILPRVHEKKPNVRLTIAGATPHPNVLALAGEKVMVTGWVEDIRECYAKSRIFIAPMQIGTGLQNKLLEAMAMKIPSITSDLANSALKATPGKEILIGNSPEDYAKQILSILDNQHLADTLSEGGYNFVHRNYDWASATGILENLIVKTSRK